MSTKKRGLGKGLSALLEDTNTDITSRSKSEQSTGTVGEVSMLPLSSIDTNPFQPRTHFEKEALWELTESIRQHGIIQPVTVRKMGYDKYQLISGERRFKASKLAELVEIPCFVRIADDGTMLEMALVENIQREELDAIEVAISFQRLIEECDLTQEKLSERMGKKRSTVTNFLRLLKLPAEIQLAIRDKKLTMGHAKALINISDPKLQLRIFKKALSESLSVRKLEELVREQTAKDMPDVSAKADKAPLSPQDVKLQDDLREKFGKRVKVSRDNKGGGRIVIPFESDSDLDQISDHLDV